LWFGKTKILKPGATGTSYLLVTLCKDGKKKPFWIHRLVAKAFIPNPQNLPEVNHIDEDKTNNVVSNLEWCSPKYNQNYGTCQKRKAAKLSKQVLQYDRDGNLVKTWSSITEIKRSLGFHESCICRCCNGKLKSAYKFVWKYC